MASGQQHDRATGLLALPFGLLWAPWLGLAGVMAAGLARARGLDPDQPRFLSKVTRTH